MKEVGREEELEREFEGKYNASTRVLEQQKIQFPHKSYPAMLQALQKLEQEINQPRGARAAPPLPEDNKDHT